MATDEMGGEGRQAEGGTEPAGADDIEGLDWSCLLMNVERITADPEDDDGEDIFSVKFQVDGPNANAEMDIIVAEAADVEVVALALDTLHGALTAWADLIQRRKADLRAILSER